MNGNVPVAASSDRPADTLEVTARHRVDESAVARLATTIVRVRELRGRLSDVDAMRRRLEVERCRVTIRAALGEKDMKTASEVGRDFCAARARREVQDLREEASETDALIDELDLVAQSLERERRVLTVQLGECARVAEALPTEHDRSRARHIIEDELRRLGVNVRSGRQTFTRGDTKQYGQAR